MAAVNLSGINKRFGETHVIRGVDIDIDDGAFCVLVGPSGCGKSTLLRMVAGLEAIDEGEISIGGSVVNDRSPKQRDIAMVFQNYALYPNMRVRENMSFALDLAKRPKTEIEREVKRAADILGLVPYLDRNPRQLSGGQRQRVAIGRAIVRDPQSFLFDQPLSKFEAKLRVQMRTEIPELHQRLKTTSIYVTHDQTEAMTMADKIVVLKDGVVEQAGGPLELYDRPANTFVAGFIGSPSMNLMPGIARASGGAMRVALGHGASLPPPADARAEDGQAVFYGVRPEHFEPGASGLPVEVIVVEPTGADTRLYCRHGGHEIVAAIRDRVECRSGDRIALMPNLQRAHLFDAASGRRLAS